MWLRGTVTAALSVICLAGTAGRAAAQATPQVYIGGGAEYTPASRNAKIDYVFGDSNPIKGTWTPPSSSPGFSGLGFAGVRVPVWGMYFGIEGQINSPSYGEKSTRSTAAFTGVSSDSFEYSLESILSSRFSLSATAFYPIGGLELYGRAGASYSSLTERVSLSNTGAVITLQTFNGSTYTYEPFSLDPVNFERTQHLLSPVAALGVQIPVGRLFLRFEGELEVAQVSQATFSTTSTLKTPSGSAPPAYSPVHLNGSITSGTVLPHFSIKVGANF